MKLKAPALTSYARVTRRGMGLDAVGPLQTFHIGDDYAIFLAKFTAGGSPFSNDTSSANFAELGVSSDNFDSYSAPGMKSSLSFA